MDHGLFGPRGPRRESVNGDGDGIVIRTKMFGQVMFSVVLELELPARSSSTTTDKARAAMVTHAKKLGKKLREVAADYPGVRSAMAGRPWVMNGTVLVVEERAH